MKLVALPALTDNYIWMIHDGQRALVVDPGEAGPVLHALRQWQLTLHAILVTHHHADHVMGLAALRGVCTGPIIGPAEQQHPEVTMPMAEGSRFEALGLHWQALSTPGHTAVHISYLAEPHPGTPWPGALLLCGDTLFSAGCGRIFPDGSLTLQHHSLERLAALPPDTVVCPTHEYTQANLAFARAVEPDNAQVVDALVRCDQQRRQGDPTLPTTIGQERRINPFLRTREAAVIASAQQQGALDSQPQTVFNTLRQWKNHFTA